MKKLLSILLLLCIAYLTACQKAPVEAPTQKELSYNVEMFDYSTPYVYLPDIKINDINASINTDLAPWDSEKTVSFNGFELSPVKWSEQLKVNSREQWIIYECQEDISYWICKQNASFKISDSNSVVLPSYDGSDFSENNIRKWLENYCDTLIPGIDFSNYSYSVTTYLRALDVFGLSISNKEEFIVLDENDPMTAVSNYAFTYTLMSNAYATEDSIFIDMSPTGSITYIAYTTHDVDWDAVPIDQEKLNNTIDSFLADAMSPNYELLSYDVKEARKRWLDGTVCFEMTLALSVRELSTQTTVESLCLILVR